MISALAFPCAARPVDLSALQLPSVIGGEAVRLVAEEVLTSGQVAQLGLPDAEIYSEYGLEKSSRRRFASRFGSFEVEIYQMRHSKGAFGLYAYFKERRPRYIQVGDGGFRLDNELDFWQERFFIRIRRGAASGDDPRALGRLMGRAAVALSQAIGRNSSLPPLIDHMPDLGLVRGSVRYFLGPKGLAQHYKIDSSAFGFKDEVELAVGDYRLDGRQGRLILLGYPNHHISRHYFQQLNSRSAQIKGDEKALFSRRAGVIVALLVGDFDKDSADRILGSVNYAESIKWIYDRRAERAARSTYLPLLGAVLNSLLLTLMFSLGAIAIGGAAGAFRFYLREKIPDNLLDRRARASMIRLKIYDR